MKLIMKYLLALFLAIPLLTLTSEAQVSKITKQVIGGGGMLNQMNNNGIVMSGMLGESVIFKQKPTSPINGAEYSLYQGFWVPEPNYGVGVEDNPITYNKGLSNYPNPVNSSTTIKYELKSPAYVSLKLYDMVGNQVAVIFEGYQNSGIQQVSFDTKDNSGMPLASGSYVYELNVSPTDMAGNNAFSPFLLRNVMVIVR
ncbi:MAG: FlgD immunoglobulin-like domain containing protein [Candidatus Kapaibacteriota bacterium]